MEHLTDDELQEIADRGAQASLLLLRRRGERLAAPVRESLAAEAAREKRQLYKQIKGSGMYAEWHTFHPSDKILLEDLLRDDLITEALDKRGKAVFKITDKPYPKG